MDLQVDGPLGLQILYSGLDPIVEYVISLTSPTAQNAHTLTSIVAVHGLGANPAWAWVWKDKKRLGDDDVRKVNWLAELLPEKVPYARIMTFNYESKWHKDAPKQRRSLCAEQLLASLQSQRSEVSIRFGFIFCGVLTTGQEKIKYRPLIFIGHSFGGVVIEQVRWFGSYCYALLAIILLLASTLTHTFMVGSCLREYPSRCLVHCNCYCRNDFPWYTSSRHKVHKMGRVDCVWWKTVRIMYGRQHTKGLKGRFGDIDRPPT